MNVDHFFWIDTEDLRAPISSVKGPKKQSLADELLADFRELPGRKKLDFDDFAFVNVAPSVVPTYMPSLRVFTYNVTGNQNGSGVDAQGKKKGHGHRCVGCLGGYVCAEALTADRVPRRGGKDDPVDCRLKKNRNKKACRFKKPRYNDPLSPSRTNTLWTPLGYSQVRSLDCRMRCATKSVLVCDS